MSGICGFVGSAEPAVVDAMLAAIGYRGDRTDVAVAPGVALGYRWWGGRPGKSPAIHRAGAHLVACAGTFAPPVASPAAALVDRLRPGPDGLDTLDGAFAAAWWDGERRRLTLVRDPFGVRSLYHVEHGGAFYFASELKQLLAIPGLPVEAHPVALHEYLTLSFVPGEDVPLSGVRRVLPGRLAEWDGRRLAVTPYFTRPPHPAERALRRAAPRPAVRPSGRGAGVRDPAPAQAPRPVEKYLLKEAVRDLLPPAILERPKSGMLVPVEGWLAPRGGPLHAHARERLLDGLTGWGLLRRPWLERLLAGRLGGLRPRHGAKIWLLVTLEAWLRTVLGSPVKPPRDGSGHDGEIARPRPRARRRRRPGRPTASRQLIPES